MDELRWSLLIIGAAVVIGVYLWGRRHRERPGVGDTNTGADVAEPLAQHPWDETDDEVLERELKDIGRMIAAENAEGGIRRRREGGANAPGRGNATPGQSRSKDRGDEERIIALFVVAPRGEVFRGEALRQALTDAGLRYGDMQIFHRYDGDAAVFSVANMVEPGTFDLERLEALETPGLAVFMRLPGPADPLAAFDDMVASSQRVAETLGGEVRDETRSALTRQTAEHLRESIREFQRRRRVGSHGA